MSFGLALRGFDADENLAVPEGDDVGRPGDLHEERRCPRRSAAGLRDKLTPVVGLDRIDAHLKAVYAAQGHPERWQMNRYDVEHQETPEGRQAILAFLQQFLGRAGSPSPADV